MLLLTHLRDLLSDLVSFDRLLISESKQLLEVVCILLHLLDKIRDEALGNLILSGHISLVLALTED